ncbi:hypothetical protein [Janthinobacterium sp. RB2R34]|uniref:hypothetical protein n=1 Tax=Janthinobacterium sp. RB2R34 TaxID=3424193 RepID=UPI003F25A93E
MSISIKSSPPSSPAHIPVQENLRPGNSVTSSPGNTGFSTAETVSISNSARALYSLGNAGEQPASASGNEAKAAYAKGQRDIYDFGQLIGEGNYNKQDLLPKTDDPDRLALGQQSLDYAIGLSRQPPKHAPNPFEGLARNSLSAVVYDDTGAYTEAERYAAYGELQRQDETYFSSLYAKITNGGDNRQIFKGILDYFDDLPVVEKSAYPDGFRDSIGGLYREQLEQWGPLALIRQVAEPDFEKRLDSADKPGQSADKTLQAVLEKVIALSSAK